MERFLIECWVPCDGHARRTGERLRCDNDHTAISVVNFARRGFTISVELENWGAMAVCRPLAFWPRLVWGRDVTVRAATFLLTCPIPDNTIVEAYAGSPPGRERCGTIRPIDWSTRGGERLNLWGVGAA